MLFCLSLCDETKRVILDQDYYGEVIAMVEGRNWKEAREAAIRNPVMDGFTYRSGWGWERRKLAPILQRDDGADDFQSAPYYR